MQLAFHHVALSVRNLETSQRFYEQLGFKEVHRWDAEDKSAAIVQLKLGDVGLELLAYAQNAELDPLQPETVATNSSQLGLKHIGLQVADIHACLEEMQKAGYEIRDPQVKKGRTGIDYFFIKDPDGTWIEIVQDDRGY